MYGIMPKSKMGENRNDVIFLSVVFCETSVIAFDFLDQNCSSSSDTFDFLDDLFEENQMK